MYLWHSPLNCVRDCEIRKSKDHDDFIVEHLPEWTEIEEGNSPAGFLD